MKNFTFLAVIWCLSLGAYAQAPVMNIEGQAQSVTGKLATALSLTDAQKPKMLAQVTGFLKQKAAIQPLKNSNSTAYTTKLNSMQKGLFNRLKRLLTEEQFTKLQALKPPSNEATNVLSQLFY